MPMKPAPSTALSTRRSASPMTLLIAIMPARPPEISMVTTMIRVGEMPAYFAADSDWPKARIS